jgi:hypothetical protein
VVKVLRREVRSCLVFGRVDILRWDLSRRDCMLSSCKYENPHSHNWTPDGLKETFSMNLRVKRRRSCIVIGKHLLLSLTPSPLKAVTFYPFPKQHKKIFILSEVLLHTKEEHKTPHLISRDIKEKKILSWNFYSGKIAKERPLGGEETRLTLEVPYPQIRPGYFFYALEGEGL